MKLLSVMMVLLLGAAISSSGELIGLYTFDDPGAPLTDDSGQGNTLTSAGADPTHITDGGVEGGAFEFDGFQRLIAPININVSTAPELTLGAWVKTSTLEPGLYKVMGHDNGGWDRTIGLDTRNTDEFRYTSFVGNGRPVLGTPAPESVGDWTFLAVTYSRANREVTVYVDLDSSTTDDDLVAVSEPTLFGAGLPTLSIGNIRPDLDSEGWIGLIDNAFIFNHLLDASQVTQIRDGGGAAVLEDFPEPEPPVEPEGTASGALLGFYTFDNSADPLADGSGMGNTLQVPPGGAATPTYADANGVQGGAYSFDGSQRLIAPININPTEQTELTVGAWVKTSTLEPGLRKVLGHDNGGWDRTIGLDTRDTDEFRYTSFIGNGRPVLGTPGPVSVDAWTFLAATFDQPNNEVTVFIDTDVSSLDDDLVVVSEVSGFGPGLDTFSIGSLRPDNAAEGWQGEIDNVFIAEGILTVEQLDQFRTGGRGAIESFGFGPPRENLVAFWNFDNPGAPLEDASGNDESLDDTAAPPTYEAEGGFEGGAYDFDGTQRLIADIDVNAGEIPDMTWGAWVKPTDVTPALKKIMGHDDGGWDRTIGLDTRDNGEFRYTSFTGFGRPVLDTPGPENADDWTFMAAVYSETQVTVYVDIDAGTVGDALATVTEDAAWNNGQGQFSIGNLRPDNAAEGWIGLIDNAFLYNTMLTPTQIAFIRDGGSGAIIGSSGDDPDLIFSRELIFGVLDSSEATTRAVSIQNGGRSENLTFTSISIVGPDATFYSHTPPPEPLSPGASGTVEITFDPRGQVGDFAAQLRLETNDTSQPIILLGLQATTPVPDVADPLLVGPLFSPFGTLTPGVHERTVSIENTGVANALMISGIDVIGADLAHYTVGDLPGPIAAGASGEVIVTFNSMDTFNNFQGALQITSNDATGRFSEIDVSTVVPIQAPEDALIAYYSFDDPSDPLKDDSEKGNTLEVPDGADPTYTDGDGFEGTGAFEFDGSQRLVADIDINVSEIPELTIGAWVKPTNLDPALKKIMGHDNGGWDRTIGLDTREGEFRYTSFIGNGRPVLDTPAPENTDDWTFIAVVYDQPENEVTVYVDLNAETTDDDLVAVTEPTNFNVGQPRVSIGNLRPDNANEGWVGFIDRAFFFNTVFDSETIRELRDGGILPGSEDPNVRLRGGFGDLGKNPGIVTREITIQNGGREQILALTDSRISGPDAANYTIVGELPASLEPGESATVNVTFNPNGRSGGFVAFYEIDSSDPGDPTETLDLSVLIPNSNALLAHYKLDETMGVTMLDASGNGAQGTYESATGGTFTLEETALASGTAVSLSSASEAGAGYGEIPASAGLPDLSEGFSISMWMNQSPDAAITSVLVAKGSSVIGSPFAIAASGGSLAWFSGGDQTLTTGNVLTAGEAAHVVATYEIIDGDPTVVFFVNDVEVGRDSAVTLIDDSSPSVLQIGAANGTFGFDGIIDDVQIYGEALDAERVNFLFTNPGEPIPGDGGSDPDPGRTVLTNVDGAAGGLMFALPTGGTWDIEYSENLISWLIIANALTGTFGDTDAVRTAKPSGYYRAAPSAGQ